jgi:hypothetical protein
VSIRRDYKPAANRQRRRQNVRRNGLLVMTLVLIGLFGGLLAYIKGARNQPPATSTVAAPSQPAAPIAKPAPPKVAAPEPVSEPAPTRPKYDFYTELPKRQVEIPPDNPAPRPALRPAPPRPAPANEPPRKPAAQQKSAPTPNMAATAGSRPANGHSGE